MAEHQALNDRSMERLARAGLTRVVERGDTSAVKAFGDLTALEVWDRLRAGDADMAPWLAKVERTNPEKELDRAAEYSIRLVIPGDDEWPTWLDSMAGPGDLDHWSNLPFGLWVRGSHSLRDALDRSLTLVGARAASQYGEHIAGELSAELAHRGVTIVSGGAYGVDAAAHRGALAAEGVTIAVMPCGVDLAYPRGNGPLFERMANEGLLISELPPGAHPTRQRSIARNRIIAASSFGTVVVEAALRSGSLNTAAWAQHCGRTLMAVPGPVTSTMSEGNHALIRDKAATLVTDYAEVLEAVDPHGERFAIQEPTRTADREAEMVTRSVLRAVLLAADREPTQDLNGRDLGL